MVAGVGNAVIAPLQNAGFSKSAGKGVAISEFDPSFFDDNNNQNNEITGSEPAVSVTISPDGLNALARSQKAENNAEKASDEGQTTDAESQSEAETDSTSVVTGNPLIDAAISTENNKNPNELTEEEEKQVEELKQRDQEVRQHEQAHKTVGGAYAGAIQYETTTGPDGREYAVAGEVDIDVSPVPNNPEATIRKMEVVERAALAPAEPSPQDIQVARAAQQARVQAQTELQEQKQAEQDENSKGSANPLQTSPIDELQSDGLNPREAQEDTDVSSALVSILFGTATS